MRTPPTPHAWLPLLLAAKVSLLGKRLRSPAPRLLLLLLLLLLRMRLRLRLLLLSLESAKTDRAAGECTNPHKLLSLESAWGVASRKGSEWGLHLGLDLLRSTVREPLG